MERAYIIEEWPGPWGKWARNYLSRNMWRISHVIGNDIEDGMAEAALTYVEVRDRYGAAINSPQHFMKLFQMAFSCWVTDLANKDSHIREGISKLYIAQQPISPRDEFNPLNSNDRAERVEPSIAPDAELAVLLNDGSSELKEVLSIIFYAPKEVMDVLRAEATSYSPRQFWNRVLAHCKIPPERSAGLMKELNDLLG